MQQQEHEVEPNRVVILGMPYTIRPTEDLTAQDINALVKSIKELVDSYSQKGYDERRIPLLVAFHIADEKRRLQESQDHEKQQLQELHDYEKQQLQESHNHEKQRLQESYVDGKRQLQESYVDERRRLQESHDGEKQRLQESYQLPLQRLVEKLQSAIEEDA